MDIVHFAGALRQDLRYAVRQLRLHPGFALTAVASLALGIGANTAIFTLTDQIVVRLLPVERPHELVQLRVDGGRFGSQSGDGIHTFSHPAYLSLRARNTVFSGLTGQALVGTTLTGAGRSEAVSLALVAGNYFDVFGVKAFRGRGLSPEDDRVLNGSPVAVLQYDFWRTRFADHPDIVGSTLRLNGSPFTVIGVAAPGFEGTDVGFPVDMFVPVTMKPTITPTDEGMQDERYCWFYLFARLKPGVTRERAEAAMKVTYRQLQEQEVHGALFQRFPYMRDRFLKQSFSLEPAARGQSSLRARFERPLLLLQWLVGAVLLIACSNVAGLLLARAAAREREMAIRGSLGAGRGHLIRQLLVESLLVASFGALAGAAAGRWVTRALVYLFAADPSRISLTTAPDLRVLVFATALVALTTLLFGLLPAWQASRTQAGAVLKESSGTIGGARSHVRLRKLFVGFQVGLSAMLLIGAGLFARSLSNLRNVDLGLQPENVVTFFVRPATVYDDARKLHVYRSLIEGLATVPGVKAVGANQSRLFTGGRSDGSITLPGAKVSGDDPPDSFFHVITPGYFDALGIPIKAGRDLSWRDWGRSANLCIVNDALVSEYLGGRTPVGQRLGRGTNAPLDFEVIGVAANARYHDVRGEIPRQTFFAMDSRIRFVSGVNVYARVLGDPRAAMAQLRDQVRRIDPDMVVSNMLTLDAQLNTRLANERMLSFLSAGFAILAAVLAITGLYGVLTFIVTRRNREIGIRMALGAQRGGVIRLVVGEMLAVIFVGIGAGVAAAYVCGRFIETQLFGIQPFDAAVFAASAGLLAAFSLAAAFLPAWRAARLNPTAALRQG